MSDTEFSIWDAKNNLSYNEPLEVGNPLFVDTASARGDFNINRLYRDLNIDNQGNVRSPPRKQYMLFTGHRGCGKSTELLRVADYLHAPERYYVIHLDCLRKLDTNNLKYSDILLALAADELTSQMLFNLLVLEYNNYFWKSHPVITTLPGYQKALEHAGTA